MKIGIGIDTGGTCTDAVAYDFEGNLLLAKSKALTTREDLSAGIRAALDRLPPEYVQSAESVVLSTTLATNACVENKGCRAKLFIFGLDDSYLRSFNAGKYGLRPEYVRGIDTHSSADGLTIDEPDWDALLTEYGDWMRDAEALTAAELYGTRTGAPCEKKLKALAEQRLGVECVCANEINNNINVIARGATALLNARLFPIIREFIRSAEQDLAERGCRAALSVVRSDGTLMSAESSRIRPVETILSGPAASISAGKYLTDAPDYLIIDMGGTTTDVSIVKDGKPVTSEAGIRIGAWKTLVNGVYVDTFALGGDSHLRIEKKQLKLLDRRVLPLCAAAARYPGLKEDLRRMLKRNYADRDASYEFFCLVKEPAELSRYNTQECRLIDVLKQGPCMIFDLPEKAGISLYNLKIERLEDEGVILRCGLTPTDFMHLKGDYSEYDREASALAAACALNAYALGTGKEELEALADRAYDLVCGKLYRNLCRILMAREQTGEPSDEAADKLDYVYDCAWAHFVSGGKGYGTFRFDTPMDFVGLGAPVHVFLPRVARAFGARCLIPEHASVANALGALKAEVSATVSLKLSYRSTALHPYILHTPEGSLQFDDYQLALAEGRRAAAEAAEAEARRRGAAGPLRITVSERSIIPEGSPALGGYIIAEAGV